MRKIGSIASERDARRFSAFLHAAGMPSQADVARDGSWEIWVHDDTHLPRAIAEFESFVSDPSNDRYEQGARAAAKLKKQEAEDLKRSRSRIIDARSQWGIFRNAAIGSLTLMLIGVCIALYIMPFIADASAAQALRRFLMITTPEGSKAILPEVLHGQVWRIFTPALLHGSILHILFNMMWLKQLGSSIENIEGSLNFGLQVLVYGIAGNLLQYFTVGPWFLGMSGVVYGLFGYVWICAKHDPSRAYVLDRETVIWMCVWFALCFTGLLGPIANGAHAGGFLAGILWATITVRQIPFTKVRF